MSTRFLVILTFLVFQTFGTRTITASSNVTCIQMERESLLQFKQAVTDSHHLLSTWSGLECCEWHGVGCDSLNGHVVKLDLRSPGEIMFNYYWLEGELSHSLQNLKHLRYLDLSINNFTGNIPKFLGSFERLEYLNLSQSGFYGIVPHHLGNLSRLQYLDFKNCFVKYYDQKKVPRYMKFLKAPIINDLGWVSSLSLLRYLDLSGITISKHTNWFHQVNMLHYLHTLNLAWSGISIPPFKFINFTSLRSLDLSKNHFNSIIPIWLSNLTTLVNLDLSENMLSGPIPAGLGQLLSLEDLNLNNNQLTGNIPVSVGQLSKLKSLDLSYNSLVGVLSETHFTKLKNLIHLDLSLNSLALNFSSQWIPPFQLKKFFASSCSIGPHFPNFLQTTTNLQRLDLSNSSIRDTIPEWFENILYHILYLDLSNNQISGKLPQFHFVSSNCCIIAYLEDEFD